VYENWEYLKKFVSQFIHILKNDIKGSNIRAEWESRSGGIYWYRTA